MRMSPTNIASRAGIFFFVGFFSVGMAVLLTGCDVVSHQETTKITYTVTNDLGERLTVASEDKSANAVPASATNKASSRFTIKAQVTPPEVSAGDERASHVTHSSFHDKLYAGYMIRGDGPGNGFGGGIDIIDVSDADSPNPNPQGTDVNALQVDGVDVQESAVNNHTLFVGVAEEESFDVGNSPSEVHSIDLVNGGSVSGTPSSGSTIDFEDQDLPGNLVKAVTQAPNGDTDFNFYAVTDVNTFHRFNVMPDGVIRDFEMEQTTSYPAVEFRGLAANEDGGWAMDDGGNFWRGDPSGGLSRELTFSPPNFFNEPGGPLLLSIARVTSPEGAPTCGGTRLVFAALNNDGFRVIKTSGSGAPTEVFRNSTLNVTSVTATTNYVYVANGRSIALFSITSSSALCDPSKDGLRKIGMSEMRDFRDARSFDFSSRGQVNEIEVGSIDGTDYLFVAKGEDGVFIVRHGGGGSYP